MKNKHDYLVGEQNYKEVVFEYNKKILERERQIKQMQKKIDKETKAYHVKRARKENQITRQKMVDRLNFFDKRAQQVKEDRMDYMASRKHMVQKLKKDLDRMRAGLTSIEEIEQKYSYLYNDAEFQLMMQEIKKELNPGIFY